MGNMDRALNDIIEDLYAGILDDAVWDRAMRAVRCQASGTGLSLVSIDPRSREVYRQRLENFNPAVIDHYHDHWILKDPRFSASLRTDLGSIFVEQDILSMREFKRSEIYNDHLTPLGIPWFMATWLHRSEHRCTYLSIHGRSGEAPFQERDRARIEPLIPHLRRALEIQDRIQQSKLDTNHVLRAAADAPFGIAILNAAAEFIEMSDAAAAMLMDAGVLITQAGGRPAFHEPLNSRVRGLTRSSLRDGTLEDGRITVERGPERPSLSLVLAPTGSVDDTWFGQHSRWLLLILDPERQRSALEDGLRQRFGLTQRESEIAILLASGLVVKDVARHCHLSEYTVRAHLKTIFRKLDVHDQAALLRTIHNLNSWFS